MHPKLPYFLFLFLCFSLNTFLNAQTENDSLAKYSYEELHALIDSTKYNKQKLSKLYTEEYLRRAKFDNDKIKISRGYFYIMYYYYDKDISSSLKYADSIIEICKDCKHEKYPALGYYFKGYFYSLDGLTTDLALDNFLKALSILNNNNIELELDIRNAIMNIQGNWLANEETLNFINESLDFIIKNKQEISQYNETYFIALNNLSLEYMRLKEYKNSMKMAKKGLIEAFNTKDSLMYYEFISLTGTAQYYLGNYQASIDSSLKALPNLIKINDRNIVMKYYYLAKSYDQLNQPEKAQFHFLKTDSIYQATKDIFPEMRNAYEHIIEYYKSKNDTENQIKYYDRLLEVDKIIDSTYTYVTETIEKKFDTPQAIAERNRLVEEAKAKESSWKYSFAAISGILLVILGILVAAFRRQKYYKRRFESVMNTERSRSVQKTNPKVAEMSIEQSRNALNNSPEVLGEENTSTPLSVKKDIGISEEIVQNIVSQLQKFEASQQFTKQVSLTELAKKFRTNPKYLSKVINGHYQKNFSSYINDLRVEYVVSKLKEDSKFRNYTIKAIAKEAGFGKTESFSKAFHKSTGIKPSYFIKELHKRLEGD
ncbi:helix-turn-helix domain-containing protein [Kordia sp.]|uniref:helix-turn-helix domain-containing protein n=1 Tax=Kordia sp. TaxID=1965332 RepID=UPI003B5A453E